MKKLRYIVLTILAAAIVIGVKARSVVYEDIPTNSYVIGTHLYTNEVQLTTKHIMLASKTIEGHTLSDMKMYYKTSRGQWTNGLTGEAATHLSSYAINYEDAETTTTENYEDNYVKLQILILQIQLVLKKQNLTQQ